MAVKKSVVNAKNDGQQIYHLEAAATMMAISPSGDWDCSFSEAFEALFAEDLKTLNVGDVIVAKVPENIGTGFSKIIFIVDDGQISLPELVSAGLWRAREEKMASITMPLIRSRSSWQELARAVSIFAAHRPMFVKSVTIVVNNDKKVAEDLQDTFDREDFIDQKVRVTSFRRKG